MASLKEIQYRKKVGDESIRRRK